MHAARLGVVLYFLPIFFLFEPALIFQGPLYLTVIWTVLNVFAVVFIAAASEGYMLWRGRLAMWSRGPLFVAGLLIGFPEWMSTGIGLVIAAAAILLGAPRIRTTVAPPASV